MTWKKKSWIVGIILILVIIVSFITLLSLESKRDNSYTESFERWTNTHLSDSIKVLAKEYNGSGIHGDFDKSAIFFTGRKEFIQIMKTIQHESGFEQSSFKTPAERKFSVGNTELDFIYAYTSRQPLYHDMEFLVYFGRDSLHVGFFLREW